MSDLPHIHPETGEPTLIRVGYINPLIARDMRIGGRSAAYGGGRAIVDMAKAKDVAARRCGPAAERAVFQSLLALLDSGAITLDQVKAAGKGGAEILALAEGVHTGKPSPEAVIAANRIVSPEGLIAMAGDGDLGEIVLLAYATLQLDQERILDGSVS